MHNADSPAMPQDRNLHCDDIGLCPTLGTGFTKHEAVLLEFAKSIVASGDWEKELRRGRYDVMAKALSLTNTYFETLEKDT